MANIVNGLKTLNERLLSIGGDLGWFAITLSILAVLMMAGISPLFIIMGLVWGYDVSFKDVLEAGLITIVGFYVGFGVLQKIEEKEGKNNG